MTKRRDRDRELEELRKLLVKLVGEEETKQIKEIVDFSYKLDAAKVTYKVTYNITKEDN